jgi:hypothetical protein
MIGRRVWALNVNIATALLDENLMASSPPLFCHHLPRMPREIRFLAEVQRKVLRYLFSYRGHCWNKRVCKQSFTRITVIKGT